MRVILTEKEYTQLKEIKQVNEKLIEELKEQIQTECIRYYKDAIVKLINKQDALGGPYVEAQFRYFIMDLKNTLSEKPDIKVV